MNRTYRYVFFSFAEMYVETRISNEPRLENLMVVTSDGVDKFGIFYDYVVAISLLMLDAIEPASYE